MHWRLRSLVDIWKRNRRIYYLSPCAIARRGWELEWAGEKINKAVSWKSSSFILILCPNTTGSRMFFLLEDTSQDHHTNDGVIWVSITFCLSWVNFSEGYQSNWTMPVWSFVLWKSMCNLCLLFLPAKVKHCKVTEQGDSKEVNSLWKQCSCTLPASICGVNAACQLFVFAAVEKIYPIFPGEPERWTGTFHSFKWTGWEVLHFWHI